MNDPVPEIPVNEIGGSRAELMLDMARREKLTIRDLYRRIAGARGHCHISGTASEVADMMEEWVSEKGCDGFNIMPPLLPRGLAEFIDLVVPELQRRGIYRTEYEGTTLRKNLGLTRPGWSADHTGRKDAAE